MSLTLLEVEAVRQAPLSHTPYDDVLGSGVLKSDTIPDIRRDFPNIRKPGSLTVNEFDLRGRFKTLGEELESPEFTEELSRQFGKDLHPSTPIRA
jgi:SM-20-related protein